MINLRCLTLAICAVLVVVCFGLKAQSPAPIGSAADALIGIWSYEEGYVPGLHGELIVSRAGSNWRASLAGAESGFHLTGHEVRFSFAGNRGEYRGTLIKNGRTISGFWLQPSGSTQDNNDPGGSGQPFASPLVLKRAGRNLWRGTVRPLENHFTLYLKIFRNSKGTLVGTFRNPEMNSTGGSSQLRVNRDGSSVQFAVQPDPAKPEIRLNATLTTPDQLQMLWPDLGHTITLTRRKSAQASNFFPRPPGEAKYVYRQPPLTGDGWATARARDVGMDEAALARLVQRLVDADPAASRPGLIHSMLVAYRGKLVLEEYFFGFDRDQPHDTRSAAKTFASVMLGAAMKRGVHISAETRVYDLLAGLGTFANPDPRKSQITLAHLMTHTSGLACDDNDNDSPGNEGTMQSQKQQPDWWKYTLDLPVAHDPGTRYAYCSANMNLVGGALTTATHTWLPELFESTVARPLQFGTYYWNLMPTGEGYQGGGAFLRPRDFLKVGQVYLDGGVWHGRRIVNSSWVRDSTVSRVHISPATTGLTPQDLPNFYGEADDGYAWHLSQPKVGQRNYRDYAATGNGGQLLIVVPEFDLVVVFTGGNYMQGGIWSRWRDKIVPEEIIPAIRR